MFKRQENYKALLVSSCLNKQWRDPRSPLPEEVSQFKLQLYSLSSFIQNTPRPSSKEILNCCLELQILRRVVVFAIRQRQRQAAAAAAAAVSVELTNVKSF